MTALETLLAGLFDYAGLYPPASLDLRQAANNYVEYSRGKYSRALGRFIVNLDRLQEFRLIAGAAVANFKLSVIAKEDADWSLVTARINSGVRVEAVEVKCTGLSEIERQARMIPQGLDVYFELPMGTLSYPALKVIRDVGASAKLRMGGVVREAIPAVSEVAGMLKALADAGLPFKATAGLHHPLRSTQHLTYEPECPTGTMHGFMNLSGAAALLYFGGSVDEAEKVLADEDSTSWCLSENSLQWRDHAWSTDQLAEVRRQFFISIGSCSFEEPIQDLKSLGWL